MKIYHAAGVNLAFPDTLFDPLDREAAEHVIKSYLEEDATYISYSSDEKKACIDEFMCQIKPRGSCWSIL